MPELSEDQLHKARHAIAEIVGNVALWKEQPSDKTLDQIIYRVARSIEVPKIPEHMQDTYAFDPKWYVESGCTNCGQPLYRYEMDVEVRWRHFTHSVYCYPAQVAKPIDDIPR